MKAVSRERNFSEKKLLPAHSTRSLSTSSFRTVCRMTPFVLVCAVSLLHLCDAQGSSDVTPVFVLQGKDVILEVKEAQLNTHTDVFWKFNKSYNIVKFARSGEPFIFKRYQGKVTLLVKNHSLLLRNLNESDSGYYTAVLTGEQDQMAAEYKVIVQEQVSPVDLTVKSSSPDSCNFTVDCRIKSSNISKTFSCVNQSCAPEEGEEATAYDSSINVYLRPGFIFCNHSNHVSWETDEEKNHFFCGSLPVSNEATIIALGITAPIASLVVLSICLFIKWRRKNCKNTVYEVPQSVSPVQTPTECVSDVSTTSTYALVAFHTGPRESTKTKNPTLPETVYALVQRDAKFPPKPTPRA
ncbi:SLAM family member 9-like [Xiphias gladius]|uniref:SLAM family member 9-like n=1 Tax=Xiphias gladius TaxID=8245 RepID=UPI001A98C9C3|nr:SLAM family member 9-like [Xiphias gladius]